MASMVARMAFAIAVSLPFGAMAQTVRHQEAETFVQTADGVPRSCGTEFQVVYNDDVDRPGQLGAVGGSIAFAEANGNFVALLKFTPIDFPDGPAGKPAPFAAAAVSLDADGTSLPPTKRYTCETNPAFSVCGIYGPPQSVAIYTSLERGTLALNFNRKAGDLDHTLPLSPKIGLRNPAAADAYQSCIMATLQRAVDRSKLAASPQSH